jgi:simple sugar transport system substrate-binding protein
VLVAVALGAVGCGGSGSGGGGGDGEGGGQEQVTVGALINQPNVFFQQIQTGMEQGARESNVRLLVNQTDADQGKETQLLNDFQVRQVDAVAVSALSVTGSVAALKAMRASDVPVVCYNSCVGDASPQVAAAFVASNQERLGRRTGEYAAKYIKQKLGGRAVIGIINCDVAEECKERKAGFKAALAEGGVKARYVADQYGDFFDKAVSVGENMLTANPQINVMWSAYEDGTAGETAAVVSRGRVGKVVTFGTDMSPKIAQQLLDRKNPVLQAATGQSPVEMGRKAIEDAATVARGGKVTPFRTDIPEQFYSRDDPAAVRAFLRSLG